MTKKIYYDFLKLKKVRGSLSAMTLGELKKLAMQNGFMSQSNDKQIDLSGKVKSLKLGNLIINIHNNLGGSPQHPYIDRVSKMADVLPESRKQEVEKSLQPHIDRISKMADVLPEAHNKEVEKSLKPPIEKAKKFAPVVTTKPISKINHDVISSSLQKKPNVGIRKKLIIDKGFQQTLEQAFSMRPPNPHPL